MKALLLASAAAATLALAQPAAAQNANHAAPATASPAAAFVPVPPNAKLTSEFIGLNVYNNDNKDIGTIKDIALMDNGGQAYILSVGGFLGMGTRYIAVNPSEIHVTYNDTSNKLHASMNATVDQLKSAPEFKYVGAWAASKS